MAKVWEWLDRVISQGRVWFLTVSGWLIAGVMGLLFVDVVMRYAFNQPLPAVYELTEGTLMVAIIFFGVAAASHVRVSLFTHHLRAGARLIVELVVKAISISYIALMAWQTTRKAVFSYKTGEAAEAIVRYPVYPARSIVALCLFLFLLVLVASFVKTVKRRRANDE